MTNKQKRAILMAQLEQKVMDSAIQNAGSAKIKSDAVFVYQKYLDAQLDEITKRSDILTKNRKSKKELLTELKTLNNRRESISRFVYQEIEDKEGNIRYFKVTPTQPRVTMLRQTSSSSNPKGLRQKKKDLAIEDITDVSFKPIFTDLKDRLQEITKDNYDGYVLERENLQKSFREIKEELQKNTKVYDDIVRGSDKFDDFKDRYEILSKQMKRGDYYLDLLNKDRKKFDAIEYDEDRKQWIPVVKDKVENKATTVIPITPPTPFTGANVDEKDSDLFQLLPKTIKEIPQNIKDGVGAVGQSIQKKIGDVFKGQPITDSMGKNQTQVEAQANAKMSVMQNRVLKNQNNNVSGNNLKKINV